MKIKKFLVCFIASLTLFELGFAAQCPSIESINRQNGEYEWHTWQKGWVGEFFRPLRARGRSYHVTAFLRAAWYQLQDTKDSKGYIACYYQGDCGDEIIRFVQADTEVVKRPRGINWYCGCVDSFPSVACSCSGVSPDRCKFSDPD